MTLISLPTLYGVDNLVICGKSLGMLLASEIFFISKVKYIYIRASLNNHYRSIEIGQQFVGVKLQGSSINDCVRSTNIEFS